MAITQNSWFLSGVLFILFWVALSVIGLLIVKKYFKKHSFKESHDVGGFTYNILGVLYAVILGFSIVNVQEKYNHAYLTIEKEVGALSDLFRDASVFPDNIRDDIRFHLKKYVDLILSEEWAATGKFSPATILTVRHLWKIYYGFEPKDTKDQIWLQQSIDKLNNFNNFRLERIFDAKDTLSPILWCILIIGAVFNVVFLYFFHIDQFKIHLIYVVVLSSYISFMLYLIWSLDKAYQGVLAIEPEAFMKIKEIFANWT